MWPLNRYLADTANAAVAVGVKVPNSPEFYHDGELIS